MLNEQQLIGNWEQVKGLIKEKWGRLTDNDLTVIEGRREQMIGKLHELYGLARKDAERQFDEFMRTHDRDRQQRKAA